LPSVLSAKQRGWKTFFIPKDNLFELEYIPEITIYPIEHFSQLVGYFVLGKELKKVDQQKDIQTLSESQFSDNDFAYIKG